MSFNEDEIDRRLLAEQEEFEAGGNGQGSNEELEFPMVDQDLEQHSQKIPSEVILTKLKEGPKTTSTYIQKYSNDNLLAEAVIVGGIPYFAVSMLNANGEVSVTLEKSITVGDATEYKPFGKDLYLNNPYWFKSREQFESTIEVQRKETLDTMYRKVKSIWTKYIDADDFHISICAADTILTFYQDKIGMVHYLFFVGGNDSGNAFLYRIVKDMIKSKNTTKLESGFIWGYIKSNLPGAEVPGRPLSYDTSEFDVITQKEIIQTLEHVFGAKSKKSNGIRKLYFDVSKLQRLGNVYDLATEVKVIKDGDDSFEHNRGSDWTDWTDVELDRHITTSTDELKESSIMEDSERESTPDDSPVDSPHPPYAPYPTLYDNSRTLFYSCYVCAKDGDDFSTDIEDEYVRHGGDHYPNTLLYPTKTEIEKYGLKPQGKPWER